MRFAPWLLAAVAAVLVLIAAPSARADQAFLTLSGSVTTPRVPVMTYDAGTTPAQSTGANVPGLAVTLGDWTTVPAFIGAIVDNRTFTVALELTKPNAHGVETTYATMTYSNATLVSESANCAPSNAAGGGPSAWQELAFQATSVATTFPDSSGHARPEVPRHVLAGVLARGTVAPDAQIGDAYVSSPQVSNGTVALISQVVLNINVWYPNRVRTVQIGSMVTKPVAPPAYGGMLNKSLNLSFSFVKHNPGVADRTLFTLKLNNAALVQDAVSGNPATEIFNVAPTHFEFTEVSPPAGLRSSVGL